MGLEERAQKMREELKLFSSGIESTKEGLCLQSKKGKGEEKLLSALREEIRSSDVCTKGF